MYLSFYEKTYFGVLKIGEYVPDRISPSQILRLETSLELGHYLRDMHLHNI